MGPTPPFLIGCYEFVWHTKFWLRKQTKKAITMYFLLSITHVGSLKFSSTHSLRFLLWINKKKSHSLFRFFPPSQVPGSRFKSTHPFSSLPCPFWKSLLSLLIPPKILQKKNTSSFDSLFCFERRIFVVVTGRQELN